LLLGSSSDITENKSFEIKRSNNNISNRVILQRLQNYVSGLFHQTI
jgi:hypothetical protein